MPIGNLGKPALTALSEIHGNQQVHASPSPTKLFTNDDGRGRSRSPVKSAFPGLKSVSSRWAADKMAPTPNSRETSPTKPPKSKKSSTNLAALLSRPKSFIHQPKAVSPVKEPAALNNLGVNKENKSPDSPLPPIYAQFATPCNNDASTEKPPRSQSCYSPSKQQGQEKQSGGAQSPSKKLLQTTTQDEERPHPSNVAGRRNAGGSHVRAKSAGVSERAMGPTEIAVHLEALLDRRNIPQNQRYKMRNLNDTIKMEFIRQDWAEMKAAQSAADDSSGGGSLPRSDGSATSTSVSTAPTGISSADNSDPEEDTSAKPDRGRSRRRNFTFSRTKRDRSSPKKPSKAPKFEATMGRRFRSKSTESVGRHHPESSSSSSWSSSSSSSGPGSSGMLAKIKFQQGPGDYVAYLRKVQKPELVEVGKVHKLRLLLRNETVAWTEEFIGQGGLEEIVRLLNRIIKVEWREEHEDALLHENLLCLKALSTTALGTAYLHSIQADLFPKLLHLIFDPEKKGPSEFTTRNIVTSILVMYISSATPAERIIRAKNVLGHLRDPQLKEEDRPLPFVLKMHQNRPYRVWCKEVSSVTKEVFWIFLHKTNVIALPKHMQHSATTTPLSSGGDCLSAGERSVLDDGSCGRHDPWAPNSYMNRHFAAERDPVAAAPYVGGVEWDATNYLASHLDLMNAIVACLETREARNALRALLRISGWERCMGGSMRLCKEKFYGSVHAALRTWVAAAVEDGWDVRDVRFGPASAAEGDSRVILPVSLPSASPLSRKMEAGQGGGGPKDDKKKIQKKIEPAPRLEMPRFDLEL